MFRIAAFILLLFALAFGFAWLADNPGSVTVQWDWLNQGEAYEFDLITLIIALGVVFLVSIFIWWSFFSIINSPKAFGRWRSGRRRDKGYAALSKGLVAAGAGNVPLAKQLARESGKFLDSEPLVAMLEAQTALLDDDRPAARKQFNSMLQHDETRLLGLRGLYLEAEKEGAVEAAAHFAKQANELAPGTPWAASAVLKVQTISGQWQEALKTLEQNRSTEGFSKAEHDRTKAILLTALSLEIEDTEPEQARIHSLAACKLAPGLVPAAATAARLLVRLNDTRKAGKILEAAWRLSPHPDISSAYVNLNPGDSADQRLTRAKGLKSKSSEIRETNFAIARAALDAGEFTLARDAMEIILRNSATEQACLLMADIEEAEYGDRGRVREWLSRAVSALPDPAWISDGIISDEWMPTSPVNGRLDAFEWKAPVQQLNRSGVAVIDSSLDDAMDLSLLAHQPLDDIEVVEIAEIEIVKTPPRSSDGKPAETTEGEIVTRKAGKTVPENDNLGGQVKDKTDSKSANSNKPKSTATSKAKTAAASAPSKTSKTAKAASKKAQAKKSAAKPAGADNSPYQQADLDQDQDGVIDHRPDDPGVGDQEEQKKGWLF